MSITKRMEGIIMLDKLETLAAKCLKQLLKILSLGAFHRNRIVFFSYHGKQYSCNPKYISEYITEHLLPFDIVWAFEHPSDYFYLKQQGIFVTKYLSLSFLRICLTSRYVITNSEIPSWFPITKKQTLINTWHGGGAYKRVGDAYKKENLEKQKRAELSRKTPCIYLSSSKAFTQMTLRESFRHNGKILETGMPRNDYLVSQNKPEIHYKVRNHYSLPNDCKLLLYAPTYRNSKKSSDYLLDYAAIHKTLSERFGGEWYILLRMHHFVMEQLPKISAYIDASLYPDMQELLYASDILVTDYSSSMWDFALTGKPCFLYAPDLVQYDLKRGFYTDIHTWPYPLAENIDELVYNFKTFNPQQYKSKISKHLDDLGNFETGKASQTIVKMMLHNL